MVNTVSKLFIFLVVAFVVFVYLLDVAEEYESLATFEVSKESTYLGCHREFGGTFEHFDSENQSLTCFALCFKKRFFYVGLRNGNECGCGKSYDSPALEEECNIPCQGDKNKYCGGASSISVYATKHALDRIPFYGNKTNDPIYNLTHYWPINGGSMDIVGRYDIETEGDVEFVPDRFNNQKSALHLKGGYCKLPNGVYISGEFTFMLWINLNNKNDERFTILDIERKGAENKIELAVDGTNVYIHYYQSSNSEVEKIKFENVLPFKKWFHLVFAMNSLRFEVYVDGELINEKNHGLSLPKNSFRDDSFIGRSNYKNVVHMYGFIDDIKIFNKALSYVQIVTEKDRVVLLDILKDDFRTKRHKKLQILPYFNNKPSDSLFNLINYWPINGDTKDIIGDAHLYNGINVKFDTDKNGERNSALNFESGSYNVPEGAYLHGEFTVMVLIKPTVENHKHQRIFEFNKIGYHAHPDEFLFSWVKNKNLPQFGYNINSITHFTQGGFVYFMEPTYSLNWYHLAVTWSKSSITTYRNGKIDLSKSNTFELPRNVLRNLNHFGHSALQTIPKLEAFLDDIKFFNKALSPEQVKIEFERSPTNFFENNNYYASRKLMKLDEPSVLKQDFGPVF